MGKKVIGPAVDEELTEALRDAIWHVGRGLTFASCIEEGMGLVLERLKQEYNRGKNFPRREGKMKHARE